MEVQQSHDRARCPPIPESSQQKTRELEDSVPSNVISGSTCIAVSPLLGPHDRKCRIRNDPHNLCASPVWLAVGMCGKADQAAVATAAWSAFPHMPTASHTYFRHGSHPGHVMLSKQRSRPLLGQLSQYMPTASHTYFRHGSDPGHASYRSKHARELRHGGCTDITPP